MHERACAFLLALMLVLQAEFAFAQSRPEPVLRAQDECNFATLSGARSNPWERAKATSSLAFCNVVAMATARLGSEQPSGLEVLELSERAIQLREEGAAGHTLRGRALSLLGRWQEAQVEFERARSLQPTLFSDANHALDEARALVHNGRLDEATLAYKRALDASHRKLGKRALHRAEFEAGVVAMRLGPHSTEEAAELLQRATIDCDDEPCILWAATLNLATDRLGAAAKRVTEGKRPLKRGDPVVLDTAPYDWVLGPERLAVGALACMVSDNAAARSQWAAYAATGGIVDAWREHAERHLQAIAKTTSHSRGER